MGFPSSLFTSTCARRDEIAGGAYNVTCNSHVTNLGFRGQMMEPTLNLICHTHKWKFKSNFFKKKKVQLNLRNYERLIN